MGKRNVIVRFRVGTINRVPEKFTECTVEYCEGWVKVTDKYGDAKAYPADLVCEVDDKPTHYDRGS